MRLDPIRGLDSRLPLTPPLQGLLEPLLLLPEALLSLPLLLHLCLTLRSLLKIMLTPLPLGKTLYVCTFSCISPSCAN